MSEGAMLHANDLVKTYVMGDNIVRALDGVSLEIESGEMVAIRGPSGSGKSTLMNILGCLDRPTSGRYVLAGEDVSQMNDSAQAIVRNRKIGFVFQTFNLLPRMRAVENVELPLLYAGSLNAKKKAMAALEAVGLAERYHHYPNQLSGGQKQRVAIARAMVTDPAIILADEPTGALDTKTGEDILNLFKNLNEHHGRTIILVTHDLKVAEHCQREIYIRDGKIVPAEGGATSHMHRQEATQFKSMVMETGGSEAVAVALPETASEAIAEDERSERLITRIPLRPAATMLIVGFALVAVTVLLEYLFPLDANGIGIGRAIGYLILLGTGTRLGYRGARNLGRAIHDNRVYGGS